MKELFRAAHDLDISVMHTSSTPTPLTIGKLLGRTFGICRAHSGVFLRTATIFYLPLAVLAFFYVEDILTATIFSFLIFPIEALVSLSLISHCVELLHGRPLAVKAAVGRGLRRLPADIGMQVASGAVYLGVTIIAGIPIWVGLFNTDFPLDEIRDAFSAPYHPGEMEAVTNVLGNALWGGVGSCLTGLLSLIAFAYLSARWVASEVALMAEGTGPLESLGRSWNLSRNFVLRTVGYLLLLSIAMGLVGALNGALVEYAAPALLPSYDLLTQFSFSNAVAILLDIFIMPFYVTTLVLYYFDLRVRREKYNWEEG